MKNFIFPVLLGCSLILVSGCGQKAPPGFPAIYPMTVTITEGATPLPNVRITFRQANDGSGAPYVSSGMTNAGGVATIGTIQGSYAKKGIPEGEFFVTLEEIIEGDSGLTPVEFARLTDAEKGRVLTEINKKQAEVPRKIPEVLCKVSANKSAHPLRYTAKKGKNALSIDVAQYKE